MHTSHEHPDPVDLEQERRALAVLVGLFERLLDEFDCPEPDALRQAVQERVALDESQLRARATKSKTQKSFTSPKRAISTSYSVGLP